MSGNYLEGNDHQEGKSLNIYLYKIFLWYEFFERFIIRPTVECNEDTLRCLKYWNIKYVKRFTQFHWKIDIVFLWIYYTCYTWLYEDSIIMIVLVKFETNLKILVIFKLLVKFNEQQRALKELELLG